MVRLDKTDVMDKTVLMDVTDKSSNPLFLMSHALSAHQAQQETKDSPDKRDPADQRELPARTAKMATRALPDSKDLWATRDQSDHQDQPDHKDNQAVSIKSTDPLALPESQDSPVQQERRVFLAKMARTPAEWLAHPETLERPDQKETLAHKDHPDLKAHLARPVLAIIAHRPGPHRDINPSRLDDKKHTIRLDRLPTIATGFFILFCTATKNLNLATLLSNMRTVFPLLRCLISHSLSLNHFVVFAALIQCRSHNN